MLYSRFASFLFRSGQQNGYQLMGADASSPSEATYFHMQKIEGISTFIYVTVVDTARADWQAQLQKNEQTRQQAVNLLKQMQSVALVYLLVEPTVQIDAASVPASVMERYEGQSVYSVFWRMALDTGQHTTLPEQPSDLFGLRGIIKEAYQQAAAPEPETTFDAVTTAESMLSKAKPSNTVPMRRTLPPSQRQKSKHGLRTRMRYVQISNYPRYTHAVICYGLLAINLAIFLAMTLSDAGSTGYFALRYLGIFPPVVIEGGEWWRLVTAMFMHFDVFHLLANSFGIIVFGTRIERYFGRTVFVFIYFGTGLMASLVSLANLRFFDSFAVSGGASGAVYGLVGMVFVVSRVTDRYIETLHWRVMLIFVVIGIIMGFSMTGIDNAGHIGGMIGGVIAGFLTLLYMMRKQKL
ncbi:MAG: rhomboid family intramembrane serine protease [Defluviitaleaceae bacterium]|nr:rhomboid family intramembrane serine protease [Defluviitaleaceae bacterium]